MSIQESCLCSMFTAAEFMESAQMCISEYLHTENMEYSQNWCVRTVEYYSVWSPVSCKKKMDRNGNHYAKWYKPVSKVQIPCFLWYVASNKEHTKSIGIKWSLWGWIIIFSPYLCSSGKLALWLLLVEYYD